MTDVCHTVGAVADHDRVAAVGAAVTISNDASPGFAIPAYVQVTVTFAVPVWALVGTLHDQVQVTPPELVAFDGVAEAFAPDGYLIAIVQDGPTGTLAVTLAVAPSATGSRLDSWYPMVFQSSVGFGVGMTGAAEGLAALDGAAGDISTADGAATDGDGELVGCIVNSGDGLGSAEGATAVAPQPASTAITIATRTGPDRAFAPTNDIVASTDRQPHGRIGPATTVRGSCAHQPVATRTDDASAPARGGGACSAGPRRGSP